MCEFKCSKKSNYNIHLTSNKHIQNAKIHDFKNNTFIKKFFKIYFIFLPSKNIK